jgi:iron complex transport system ATP-binding protein
LSGGEFQRVLVARALAQEPELLILDEPVTGLDIRYQYELLSRLKELSRQGLAVVLSIHDLNLASLFSDRILLLKNGAVRGCGTPEDVLDPAILSEVYGISLERFSHPGTGRPQFTCSFS